MFSPILDNLLVFPIEKDGILTTPTAADLVTAKVISVGNGTPRHDVEPQIDDIVYYKRGNAREIKLEGKTYHVISESDIIVYETSEA